MLRFEAEMETVVYPEDADRRFIIAYSLQDDEIAVYEQKRRNSGFMEGKFAEKGEKRNPVTRKMYRHDCMFVGNVVTIASVGLKLLRPDEYTLAYMEENK